MTNAPLLYGALFALACVVLLVLPFAPAWLEWRRPSDCAALPIREDETDDPLFLAERLRARIAGLRADGGPPAASLIDAADLPDAEAAAARAGQPILAAAGLQSLAGVALQHPLYATADIRLAGRGDFTEVMAEGGLELGPLSRICRWGHADAAVRLGEGSVAAHRLSSSQQVRLERGCCFQRVHAPLLQFGTDAAPRATQSIPAQPAQFTDLPGALQRSPGLWRVDGDCTIPPRRVYQGSLVVTGVLTVGKGSRVEGSVKGYRGIVVGREATVTGAVVSGQAIHLLPHAEVGGPLVSERHVLLSAGCRVGGADAPTTVSADAIVVEEGAEAHGTLWARRAGVVVEGRR